MPNNRLYYPAHYVAIGPYCSNSGIPVHGVQSVNMTTSFNLEQVFELGQIEIYENIEGIPNIEMTIEKVLDGYPLVYHLGTRGATSSSLSNRTNQRADIFLSTFSDALNSSSGAPLAQAYCSGMYTQSLNYTIPVQGQVRESVTFVGNDKVWKTSSFSFNGHFNNNDSPASPSGTMKRQNVKMGAAPTGSIWPTLLPGVTVVNGSGYNIESAGVFGAHLQDVSVSTSLNREDLFELGRRKPYYRFANFPVAVSCTINMTAGGTIPYDAVNANSDSIANLTNEPIMIKLDDGTIFDLGNKNKLQSVSYSGGDSTGGVVTVAYQFQNFNKLDIKNPRNRSRADYLPNYLKHNPIIWGLFIFTFRIMYMINNCLYCGKECNKRFCNNGSCASKWHWGQREDIQITPELHEVIEGTLFSDAGLELDEKQGFINPRYYFKQKSDKLEYVEKVNSYFNLDNKISLVKGKTTIGTITEDARFKTRTSPNLLKYYHRWYKNRTKIIPEDFKVTPLSLLHAYIGDGFLEKTLNVEMCYRPAFCTHCFDFKDIDRLFISQLKELDIDAYIFMKKEYIYHTIKPVTFIRAKSMKNFFNFIRFLSSRML